MHAHTFLLVYYFTLNSSAYKNKPKQSIPSTTLIGTCTGMSIDRDQLIHHRSASTAVVDRGTLEEASVGNETSAYICKGHINLVLKVP